MPKISSKESITVSSPPIRPQKVKRAEEFAAAAFSIYANDVNIQTSPWDMRLRFGDIVGITDASDPTVNVKVMGDVKISLQLAKKLVGIMLGQLQSYEENIGEIPVPQDLS